jgi:hypothetical protein
MHLSPDKWGHRELAVGVVALAGVMAWATASSIVRDGAEWFLAAILGWFFFISGAAAFSLGVFTGRDEAAEGARRAAEERDAAQRVRAARQVGTTERIEGGASEPSDGE